ncbi:MAG TPA: hypothetical protein VG738_22405 [Chitinophagaceae bacterium]|nr:hypothetical protein [Chitinophagaceae bacterium]
MKTGEKVEKALQSIDDIKQAKANAGLYNVALQNAAGGKIRQFTIRKIVFVRAAACIILLVGINVFAVLHHSKKQQSYNSSNAFVNEYFSY